MRAVLYLQNLVFKEGKALCMSLQMHIDFLFNTAVSLAIPFQHGDYSSREGATAQEDGYIWQSCQKAYT
jgi:hypothetical protein